MIPGSSTMWDKYVYIYIHTDRLFIWLNLHLLSRCGQWNFTLAMYRIIIDHAQNYHNDFKFYICCLIIKTVSYDPLAPTWFIKITKILHLIATKFSIWHFDFLAIWITVFLLIALWSGYDPVSGSYNMSLFVVSRRRQKWSVRCSRWPNYRNWLSSVFLHFIPDWPD